jgi:glycosyltransferase involved in cell wall biosynthesis
VARSSVAELGRDVEVSETEHDFATSPRRSAATGTQRPLQTVVVGVSAGPTDGVRDHAVLLAGAPSRENVSYSLQWHWRSARSIRAARSELRAWTGGLSRELDQMQPDAVLLHYSTFAYSYRGLPVFVRPILSALRNSRAPLVTVLHEFAYPWRRGGWRGHMWAVTQRAALIDIMRASSAVVATTEFRAEWLASRRWLPQRRVVISPVFSNLPPSVSGRSPQRGRPVVGLFGYSHQGVAVSLVLDAIHLLEDRGVHVQFVLLGAPGRSSSSGEAWIAAARSREIVHAVSFSDTLPAQELSDALAGCDVLLFADTMGPTSRKTTLAASLASGRPVVAIDGPRSWSKLVQSEATVVAAPTSSALADALGALLADEHECERLGARGRAFAEREMSLRRSARVLTALLDDIVGTQV